jgi:Ni/Fe-hydrogenase b-type cytochrome subunit
MPSPNEAGRPDADRLVFRQPRAVRLWHWINAFTIFVMLMSGLMIFNAHPQLYWGKFGANPDHPWLVISDDTQTGFVRVGQLQITTTGSFGLSNGNARAFPSWATIPSSYNLADARLWHFFFAWFLVLPTLGFYVWGFIRRHFQRDLAPDTQELKPASIWQDIKDHLRLRFPTGEAARHYNILQKLSYLGVIFVALPLVALTGLTLSPAVDTAWPWLLDLFGGRQSARSIHFLCMVAIALFIVVHLTMVLLAGPFNELRSITTGWYRLPKPRHAKR